MKTELTIILLFLSIGVMGQTNKIGSGLTYNGDDKIERLDTSIVYKTFGFVEWAPYSLIGSANTIVKSKSDTTVLNKGDASHAHEWAYKKKVLSNISCAVYHGETGCPNSRPNDFRICSGCFRHENIRTSYYSVEVPDKYEESLKRINP